MKSFRNVTLSLVIVFLAHCAEIDARAADIIATSTTESIGPDFFFNDAALGGDDFTTTVFNRIISGYWTSGSTITLKGLAWASPATGTAATKATVTFTDLGPDGSFGTEDDVVVGTITDALVFAGASRYTWAFDNNVVFVATGTGLRISIAGFDNSDAAANIRRKTTSGSVPANVKLSLAGTAVAPPVAVPAIRTWVGGESGDWDTTTSNWTNAVLGITTYSNGINVVLDDTLDPVALNTNITLNTTFTPLSLLVSNSTCSYALSGGGLSGNMSLTKTGAGILTLNMPNDFSGGAALSGGLVRVGSDNALGSGTMTFSGSSITAVGEVARTLTNAITLSTTTVLGDATDNGLLTFSGPLSYGGVGRQVIVNSDVVLSGTVGSGGLNIKRGPGTLIFDGVIGQNTGSPNWQIEDGQSLMIGGNIDKLGGGIRVMATDLTGTAVFSLTNGGIITFSGASGQNIRVGSANPDSGANSTNIAHIAGTISGVNSLGLQIGANSALAQVNLYSNGLLRIHGFSSQGTGYSEVNFDGGTLAALTSSATFMQGLGGAFVRAGGLTVDTAANSITIAQNLLDGGGGGGVDKAGNGTLILSGVNTYTGLTRILEGTLQVNGSIHGPATIGTEGLMTGSGVVEGPVEIHGTIASGPGVGKLITGGLILAGGGTNVWEISSAIGTPGDDWDLIDSGGSPVVVQSTALAPFVFALRSSDLNNFDEDSDYVWTAVNGQIQQFGPGKVVVDDSGFTNDLAGGAFQIEEGSLNVKFTANRPPEARPVTYEAPAGVAIKGMRIPVEEFLSANTEDPDGDDRVIVSFSSTNATVSASSSEILISSPNGLAESIEYVVADVRNYRVGDTRRMATNYIHLVRTNAVGSVTIENAGGGQMTMTFHGIPGYTYVVQRSCGTLDDWMDVSTNTVPSSGSEIGQIRYTETPPQGCNPAFYRVRTH
jgi:autotransporter-associated beta strand protein